MYCSLCWTFCYTILVTKNVSALPFLVKIPEFKKNQQVTKKEIIKVNYSNLVDTSETIRATDDKFSQWLAGLIDGDGSLLLSKAGYASCEITVGIMDEKALRYIQNKIGGSIKLRSGVKALRWRLHHKQGMVHLIHLIHGNIRNSARWIQLHKLCTHFGIPCLTPISLHNQHSWFSGYFDADGTITFSLKGEHQNPQLTISVTSKNIIDVQPFKDIFGGNIYFDKSQNGYYKWSVQSRQDVLRIRDYFKICPSFTAKSNRIFLIDTYYELKDLRAYKDSTSVQSKAWFKFLARWDRKF